MQATTFEYRFRYALHTLLFAIGFTAPWNYAAKDSVFHLDTFHSTWEFAATHLASAGWLQARSAFNTLLIFAILLAAAAAFLRAWGAAFLGSGIVQSAGMHGTAMVADGPYRRTRNPLYLGTFLHALALALLMPPSGAVFAVFTIGLYQFRLILREEPFLTAALGPAYIDYCARVSRLFPALTPRVPASGAVPRWPQAMLGELYMIAVPIAFAIFGWQYSVLLLIQCVVIALGLSLLARAFLPKPSSSSEPENALS